VEDGKGDAVVSRLLWPCEKPSLRWIKSRLPLRRSSDKSNVAIKPLRDCEMRLVKSNVNDVGSLILLSRLMLRSRDWHVGRFESLNY
jgi:hypothetical protein